MNDDHADAVLNCVLAFAPDAPGQHRDGTDKTDAEIAKATMTDIDAKKLVAEVTLVSGEVQQVVVTYASAGLPPQLDGPDQVRSALVTMAKKARVLLNDKQLNQS